MAIDAGLGVAAPAVPPINESPRRRTTKAMTTITTTVVMAKAIFQLRMMLTPILFRRHGPAFQGIVRRGGVVQEATPPQMLDECLEHGGEGGGEGGGREHAPRNGGGERSAGRR